MKRIWGKVILFLAVAAISSAGYLFWEEPDLFLDQFGRQLYAERLEPSMEVLLNDTQAFFSLTKDQWSIQKRNGAWYPLTGISTDAIPQKEQIPPAAGAAADQTKPAVITSREDRLSVILDKVPDEASLKLMEQESGNIVSEIQADVSDLPLPPHNGNYIYELKLGWSGKSNPYKGEYVLQIPVLADLPVQFTFSSQQLSQGQMLEVDVANADGPEDILFEQSICDSFQWYRHDGLLRGYLPTNYNVKPGNYLIKYGVKSKGTEFTQEIALKEYDYNIQYLTVDKKTEQETRNDEAYAEYNKYYMPVRKQSEPSRYYTEDFVLPVRGKLTTEFGETRYVNDQPTSYRHLGLDIAAPEGTEVKAVNRGKVVLARFFTLTGNTVMIDHGEGLFSLYHHMKVLSVKNGDMVERGQNIGEVGSTGFSTGPHLHFMISYYLTNLEPGYFLVGQPITYENYKELIE